MEKDLLRILSFFHLDTASERQSGLGWLYKVPNLAWKRHFESEVKSRKHFGRSTRYIPSS